MEAVAFGLAVILPGPKIHLDKYHLSARLVRICHKTSAAATATKNHPNITINKNIRLFPARLFCGATARDTIPAKSESVHSNVIWEEFLQNKLDN